MKIWLLWLFFPVLAIAGSDEPPDPANPPIRASGAGSIVGVCPSPENRCAPGERCVLVEVQCVRAPCPPWPRCVKR